MKLRVAIVATVILSGCSENHDGTEGKRCYGNGTCNAGLVCASNVCVKLPAIDARLDRTKTDGQMRDGSRTDLVTNPDHGRCSSLSFAGTDKVVVQNGSAFDLGTSSSTLAWLKVSAVAEHMIITSGLSGQYCGPFGMKIDADGHLQVSVRGGQGSLKCDPQATATSAGTIPLQRWVHVAAVYAASEVRLYVDGQQDSAVSVAVVDPYPSIHDVWIGLEEGPHPGIKGSLSGVQLWSRALTATEIKQSMTSSVSNTAGLVGSWPLDEGVGNVARDASGNGHNGVIVGAAWQAICPQ